MTLLQSLNLIHALLEGDTDTPLSGEDYELRKLMVNDAIDEWADQTNVRWKELFATDTGNTGDGTTLRFSLPSDFDKLNGYVVLVDPVSSARTLITPVSVASSTRQTTGSNVCWEEAGELVFNQAPANGVEIHVPYYRNPLPVTSNSSRLPMSKPRYVVHYVVARLVEQSGDYTRYNTNMQKAEDLMEQMKTQNDSLGEGVPDTIPSLSAGFGV